MILNNKSYFFSKLVDDHTYTFLNISKRFIYKLNKKYLFLGYLLILNYIIQYLWFAKSFSI